jgi:hypothetical protein
MPEIEKKKQQLNVVLEYDDWKKFKIVCLENDTTPQVVIETFIKFYVDKRGKIDDMK